MKTLKKTLLNKDWWCAALIRALRTIGHTFTASVGAAIILGDVNWEYVLSSCCLAGIASFATSLSGLPEVKINEDTI